MRSQDDIQKAHDILHAVVAGEVSLELSERDRDSLRAVHDALSWMLEGPCGYAFQKNLHEIQREAQRLGYRLVEGEEEP